MAPLGTFQSLGSSSQARRSSRFGERQRSLPRREDFRRLAREPRARRLRFFAASGTALFGVSVAFRGLRGSALRGRTPIKPSPECVQSCVSPLLAPLRVCASSNCPLASPAIFIGTASQVDQLRIPPSTSASHRIGVMRLEESSHQAFLNSVVVNFSKCTQAP